MRRRLGLVLAGHLLGLGSCGGDDPPPPYSEARSDWCEEHAEEYLDSYSNDAEGGYTGFSDCYTAESP